MADKLDDPFVKQREKLTKSREELQAQITDLQGKLGEIDRQLSAMDAYFAVLEGRTVTATVKKPRATGSRAPRGEVQGKVLEAIKAAGGDGIARGGIIEKLGAKGVKGQEQSISNALAALKKANKVGSVGGIYRAA